MHEFMDFVAFVKCPTLIPVWKWWSTEFKATDMTFINFFKSKAVHNCRSRIKKKKMKTVLVSVNDLRSLCARCTCPYLLVNDLCKHFLSSDTRSFCTVRPCSFPKQEVLFSC